MIDENKVILFGLYGMFGGGIVGLILAYITGNLEITLISGVLIGGLVGVVLARNSNS